jgi:predicted DNA-binding protein with PD1-like motif
VKSKAVDDETWVLVFEQGDEAFGGLESFAREQGLTAAGLTGIGAFREATLGYFDWESKEYEELPVAEQAEVLSLVGDVAEQDGRPVVHAHVVLGLRDGSTRGGHLLRGIVRPTLEVVLRHSPARLRKRHDPASGLALIDLDT